MKQSHAKQFHKDQCVKNRPFFTVVRSCLLASLMMGGAAANANPAGQDLKHVFVPPPARTALDTNSDGKVTATEIKAARTAEFNQIDSDASASVSLSELDAWFADKVAAQFVALDLSADAMLDASEFANGKTGTAAVALGNMFRVGDINLDSALMIDEFTALANIVVNPTLPFVMLDTSGDGVISETEYTASPLGHQPPLPGPTAVKGAKPTGRR